MYVRFAIYYVCMNSFIEGIGVHTTRVSIMRKYSYLYVYYTFHRIFFSSESYRQFPHVWNRINLSLRVKIIYEDNRKLWLIHWGDIFLLRYHLYVFNCYDWVDNPLKLTFYENKYKHNSCIVNLNNSMTTTVIQAFAHWTK